jgi:hypothetical protein
LENQIAKYAHRLKSLEHTKARFIMGEKEDEIAHLLILSNPEIA